MTPDPLLLAPCLVASDYTADLLLSMAGFPPATIARERGNALRRWRRAGWVEEFGVRLSGRPPTAPDYWSGAIISLLECWFIGPPSVKQLAHAMHEEDDDTGGPTRRLEHAIESAIDDGWLLPVRAIVLTEAGRAAVLADPEAVAVVERERAARAAARDLARVTDADVAAIDAETRGLLALAELTRDRPVPRARMEEPGRRGMPGRTVPARFRRDTC